MSDTQRRDVTALVPGGFLDSVAPGAVPMKAVLVVEYLDNDGERWLYWEASAEQRIWETQGILASVVADLNEISTSKGRDS